MSDDTPKRRANRQAVAAARRLKKHRWSSAGTMAVYGMFSEQDLGLVALVAEAMQTFPLAADRAEVMPRRGKLTVAIWPRGKAVYGRVSVDEAGDVFDAFHPYRDELDGRQFPQWVNAFAWVTLGRGN